MQAIEQVVGAGKHHDRLAARTRRVLRQEPLDVGDRGLDRRRVADRDLAGAHLVEHSHKRRKTVLARGDRGDDRHAQPFAQLQRVDLDAARLRLVHHVDGQHEGDAALGQFHGDEQAAAQVLGVGHLHHGGGLAIQQDVARHAFVVGEGCQAVESRRVDDRAPLCTAGQPALRHLDRRSGIVGDRGIAPGQRAEERGFAHVGVADQNDGRRTVLDHQFGWRVTGHSASLSLQHARSQGDICPKNWPLATE